MASVTYYGTFCDNNGNPQSAGSNGRNARATGSPIPSTATIKKIRFELDISAGKYTSSEVWTLHWIAIGSTSGSPRATNHTATMYDNEHTFTGNMSFSQSDVSKFTSGSIDVYAKANTTHDTTSYMGDFSITVEYDTYGKCGAPSSLALSSNASTGASVTLSWKAGTNGADNAVKYYQIAREESEDGITFGSREIFVTNAGNVTSYNVPPPVLFDHHYRYSVRTVGAAGTSYASDWVACEETLVKTRPDMSAYTDAAIEAGETRIKAVHITELQTNVNLLRESMGLSPYTFTAIRPGYTSLAGWSTHIAELREALDEIAVDHEMWLEITENRPRADVMMQLRRVVAYI